MNLNTYASLHNHTEFSNLKLVDSINKIEELIQYAADLNLAGIAITDHDCVGGHVRAWNYYNSMAEEVRNRFKLILGNEIYLCRSDLTAETHQKGEKFYHLILIALDDTGHEQIREISTRAWSRSYMRNIMRTPTYSKDLFEVIGSNPGHVIATTACLGGYCGTMYELREYEAIDRHLGLMKELFGTDNFFIELQPSKQVDQINYNRYMVSKYWGSYNFICTTDSHYMKKEDMPIHKVFLNSKSSGDREVDSFYASAYMMGWNEIQEYFDNTNLHDEFIQMAANTIEICNRVQEYNLKQTSIIPKIKYAVTDVIAQTVFNFVNKLGHKYEYIDLMCKEAVPADIYMLYGVINGWNKIAHLDNQEMYYKELDYECEQLYKISKQLEQPMSDYFITMAKMIDIMWEEAGTLVGPARGSAGSSLIAYLLGVTQINPLTQPVELPFWRFIHSERPGLPDIDIDTEADKRNAVFNKVQAYFKSLGGDMIHICTYGTEGSKSAIKTAARGLDIDDDVVSYFSSMIPNERGSDWTLKQCYKGDDDHKAISAFKDEMDKYPMLWKVASAIEGMVTRLGCHASGVLALNQSIWKNNAVMKTSKGILVTAFDLGDSEQLGGVKYDYLTVQALDKIHVCMNWLLEDGQIEWQGDVRSTYTKYISPDAINYTDSGMWDSLCRKEIPSAFQFDTSQGGQAVNLIQPHSLLELLTGNSVMRLMAQDGGELPLETYAKYKNNIHLWYDEMRIVGLSEDEIEILRPHLLPVYGVAASQESMMKLAMDEHIADFTIGEANILRKAVAKKKRDLLEKGKNLFYEKGLARGTSMRMLDYVWNTQIMRQAGYSFSDIHTTAYSYIAIQEMNLCYFYPSIYWKTACLSVDAGAINAEDYYNLVSRGIVSAVDEEDKREQNKIQYGKMASAIIKLQEFAEVALPDINVARFGFTPDAENNSVMFGLRGISRVGEPIIQAIMEKRPFVSLADFCNRMVDEDGKKQISKDRVVNLIKAGAFNTLEKQSREQILQNYLHTTCEPKSKLTLQNFAMLIANELIPAEYSYQVKIYNFTKYNRKQKLANTYILDANAMSFYMENNYPQTHIKQMEADDGAIVNTIAKTTWDYVYESEMNKIRAFIKTNHDDLLQKLNDKLFAAEWNKYASGDELKWELDSLNFYYSGHPLSKLILPVDISGVKDLAEDEFDGFWTIKGKQVPKYKLRTIVGAVIDKDTTKGTFILSCPDGVVNVKVFKQQFARYAHTLSETDDDGNKTILENSFFDKGTFLAVTGILKGDTFIPKVYRNTGFDAILKIVLDQDGNLDYLMRKAEE